MKTGIVISEIFTEHDTGRHPESVQRAEALNSMILTSLAGDCLLLDPVAAAIADISRVHDPGYITELEKLCKNGSGYYDADTPFCPRTFNTALHAAGAGIVLADALLAGEIRNGFAAVRPPGHHSLAGQAMGFCFFNNIAVCARYLQHRGVNRIFILDFDVHHGNGTQDAFYRDDTVFFCSLHRYPFYPGSGAAGERGEGKGLGYTLNIPLPAGTREAVYLQRFKDEVVPAIQEFSPDCILVSAGFDAHKNDPLGGMGLESESYYHLTKLIVRAAENSCQGRVLSFLEGGYHIPSLADSVFAHIKALY